MAGVPFGTGREKKQEYLKEFFTTLDKGLRPVFAADQQPLVLAGVARETELYRDISSYENIVPGAIAGSPNSSSWQEISDRATSLAEDAIQEQRRNRAVEFKEA